MQIKVDQSDLRGLKYALTKMDKASSAELRDDVSNIVQWYAPKLQNAVFGLPEANNPAQAQRVANSIKPVRDRVPYARIGGRTGGRASGGAYSGELLYGSEFGSNRFRQFPARSPRSGRGNAGWWIYPTLRRFQPEITAQWKRAVMKVLGHW